MSYIPRVLQETLKRYLSSFSVVGVTGPRQSGKSTLVNALLADTYEYVTFDDFRMMELFYDDPERFLRIHSNHVIFDEVQKVPEIFNRIKLAVDRDRRNYGKFVLTGSSQFTFLKKISESLSGRIGLLSLLPFQFSEIPENLREQSIYAGCYPEVVIRRFRDAADWYSSYLETYLTRDVRDLSNIGDMRDFRKCLQLLAARTSQVLNMSELSRDIGVSVATIKKWISILEASYILFLLPPFYSNLGKRIVKSPKVYFYDVGIVSFLTGIDSRDIFEKGPMLGPIFENYVVAEVLKKELHQKSNVQLYYFRTNHGAEVDLIVDRKQTKEWIEIKSTETFRTEFVKSLRSLTGKRDKGYLLYRGESLPYEDNLSILNYKAYLDRT